eukprot:3495581-Prymnesium_polylepis.1
MWQRSSARSVVRAMGLLDAPWECEASSRHVRPRARERASDARGCRYAGHACLQHQLARATMEASVP